MARLDAPARENIVRENLGLAYHLAGLKRYRRWGTDPLDLEQEAVLGLCQAAQKYDDARNVPFGKFARDHVIGCLWRAIMANLREEHAALPPELPADRTPASADRLVSDVAEAVSYLDRNDRMVLRARFGLEGGEPMGVIGLADHFGVSVTTMKRMLAEARMSLRAELERRGWTEHKAKIAAEIGQKIA
jgi:RNA polymerase sigma factor (sigma-70 family)